MSTKLPQRKIYHWHVFVPVYAVVLVLVMTATYFLALNIPAGGDITAMSERAPVQPGAASLTSQFNGLLLAMLAAAFVIASFIMIAIIFRRLERIRHVTESLASGHYVARTRMQPRDEVGRLGHALDSYADYVQVRHESLRESLRSQRHQSERLHAALEALPLGVIVQDLSGRVVTINRCASELLGVRQLLSASPHQDELTDLVRDRLGFGHSLADDDSARFNTQHIAIEDRLLDIQPAPITTDGEQIGTLLVVQDVTGKTRDVHHDKPDEAQQPIAVDTLVWGIANEWRQVAHSHNLNFHVIVNKPGLFVLGQEQRLRRAIGNLIDNAIKYTPPGGGVSLEVRGEDSSEQAHIWVRDNGVGIAPAEQAHVFAHFYRGRPVTSDGRQIRVPGTGQGLALARQIIEAHGGTLTLKSKQWVGTGAYVTLPLTASVSLELPLLHDLDGETVRMLPAEQG